MGQRATAALTVSSPFSKPEMGREVINERCPPALLPKAAPLSGLSPKSSLLDLIWTRAALMSATAEGKGWRGASR